MSNNILQYGFRLMVKIDLPGITMQFSWYRNVIFLPASVSTVNGPVRTAWTGWVTAAWMSSFLWPWSEAEIFHPWALSAANALASADSTKLMALFCPWQRWKKTGSLTAVLNVVMSNRRKPSLGTLVFLASVTGKYYFLTFDLHVQKRFEPVKMPRMGNK